MAQIQEFQEAQRAEVLALYAGAFGSWSAERFAARWNWQFAANPYVAERKPRIQVATDNGRVVGHLASFPIPMRLKGQRKLVLCASDLFVDKGHPTAAVSMFRAIMREPPVLGTGFATQAESMLKLSGATLLPGSAVRCSYRLRSTGALRRAIKRRLPAQLGFLAAPIVAKPLSQFWRRPEKKGTRRLPLGGVVRPFTAFTAEHEELWREISRDLAGCVDKDARYMNWRYTNGPAKSLVFLEHRDDKGKLRGIIGGGVRADLHEHVPCGTSGVVCELWTRKGDAESVQVLASELVGQMDAAGVDAVHVYGGSADLQQGLAGAGFDRDESKECQVAIKAVAEDLVPEAASDPERYWFSAGDGDMLLATML